MGATSRLPGGQGRAPDFPGRNFEILAQVGKSLLGTALDAGDHLELTLKLATEAVGAARGSVMIASHETGTLSVRAAVGLPAEALEMVTPFGEGIAGWVAVHNQPVILHGDVSDPRFEGVDPSIESSISLPLSVEGKLLGVLNIVRPSGERFTDDDLNLASSLADLAALAIEKATLYLAVRDREERGSALLGALIDAQEQERRRIAGDIHDGFLQDLSALFLKAEAASMQLARGQLEATGEAIGDIKEMVQQEVAALRDFILEVRPPSLDEIGLAPTLRAMTEKVAADHALTGYFEASGQPERLSEPVEAILYRTAQEALRNVVRHSGASSFWVVLKRIDGEVSLTVADDGSGFEEESLDREGHFGLETMRERVELAGGSFWVGGRQGGGTEVRAVIPAPPGR